MVAFVKAFIIVNIVGIISLMLVLNVRAYDTYPNHEPVQTDTISFDPGVEYSELQAVLFIPTPITMVINARQATDVHKSQAALVIESAENQVLLQQEPTPTSTSRPTQPPTQLSTPWPTSTATLVTLPTPQSQAQSQTKTRVQSPTRQPTPSVHSTSSNVTTYRALDPPYSAQSPLPISGKAMYYNPGIMQTVIRNRLRFRHIEPCNNCIGYVALLRRGDLNRRVWIQWPDGSIEGPFHVVDVAGRHHIPMLLGRGWAIDVDWETARRHRMNRPIPVTVWAQPPR